MTDTDASTLASAVVPPHFSNVDPGLSKKLPWYKRLDQQRGILLFLISLAQMLDIISIASVTIALPSILRDVKYAPNQLQWVVSSYALTYAAFLLVGGRMGDLFGHRRVFLTGTSWFAAWSLVCGFARSPVFMSVARGLQGAGAGFTIPSALALLTTSYPLGPERTFALSMFGGAACIGQTIGVLLGGIFDATIGWYWIFYITALISALLCIAGFFVISKANDEVHVTDRRVDIVGVVTFMLGIIAVVYYLSESTTAGWGSAHTLAPFLVGIALLVFFVFWEQRIDYPIMPFRIWGSVRFRASVVVIICVTATYNTMIFFTSLTFQNVLLYSPLITACCYIVHGVGLVIGLYTVTRLFVFMRTKFIMLIGFIFIIVSSIIFAQIVPGASYWHYAFPALIVNCLGLSPTWMCCQVNAVADAPDEDQGVVGAVFNVAIQLGGPIGLAISTILSQAYEPAAGAHGAALMFGYRAAFYTFGVIGGVGWILTLLLASNRDPIEFSGVAPEEKSDDAQEKGLEVVDESQISAVEGGDKTEIDEKDFVEVKKSSSSVSVAQTVIA
ncbi:MAG: major facilitator superfamily domain-containing protein [Linnemannia gamsii]|nr:MAG: major facilitator superfamily domain-containing protein [Linnemannia gamsii]